MKYLMLLMSLIAVTGICSPGKVHPKKTKIVIGGPIAEVKKRYPSATVERYEDTTTLAQSALRHGLTGTWRFTCRKNKLSHISWDCYIDDLTEANFNRCLAATRALIADYTKELGQPDKLVKGNQHFVDPYKRHHYGYEVMEARWNVARGMKTKVLFKFMGSKGEYHLLVKVNQFDKHYPYFE